MGRAAALHLLQIGPQPYGHCYAAGTVVYGAGTSMATVSRPDSTRWVVDLLGQQGTAAPESTWRSYGT